MEAKESNLRQHDNASRAWHVGSGGDTQAHETSWDEGRHGIVGKGPRLTRGAVPRVAKHPIVWWWRSFIRATEHSHPGSVIRDRQRPRGRVGIARGSFEADVSNNGAAMELKGEIEWNFEEGLVVAGGQPIAQMVGRGGWMLIGSGAA